MVKAYNEQELKAAREKLEEAYLESIKQIEKTAKKKTDKKILPSSLNELGTSYIAIEPSICGKHIITY